MSIEHNKRIVREFFAHLHHSEFDEAFALLTSDATWWIPTQEPGGMSLSKQAMRSGIDQFYRVFAQAPVMTPGRMTAEEDRVCLEQISRGGKTRSGVSYGNDYHMLFQFRDGLICEVREYMNPLLAAPLMAELNASSAGTR